MKLLSVSHISVIAVKYHFKNDESVVAQWLAHLPLVLEVPGSIPARGKENFGVRTRFL